MKNSEMGTQQLYKKLSGNPREQVIDKCRKYASWTLPYLVPMEGVQDSDELQNDQQSLGAQAVNHLSNQLYLALFGSATPFFKLELDAEEILKLEAGGIDKAQIDAAISKAELAGMKELIKIGAADPLILLLQYLIVTGNAVMKFPKKEGDPVTIYNIQNYVIKRDMEGNWYDLIIEQSKRYEDLPEDVKRTYDENTMTEFDKDKDCSLYTRVRKDSKGKYITTQAIDDIELPGEGIDTEDTLQYIPVAWKLIPGESYGRGHVEDYAGDFGVLSELEFSSLEAISIMCQIKALVDPTGHADVDELNTSANGAFVSGRKDDVSMLQYDKFADLQAADVAIQKRERRIQQAFLMNINAIRDAERVTAEEIRFVAQQLEIALGGVYTRLSFTLQEPIVIRLMERVDLPLGDSKITPLIITGVEALSRGGQLENMHLFFGDLAILAQLPPIVADKINIDSYMAVAGSARGVDYRAIMKSAQQQQQEAVQREQAQRQAVADEEAVAAAPAKQQGVNQQLSEQ